MKLSSLKDIFVHELTDLLSAEKQLVKALPKMAKAATEPKLKAGFEKHLEETKVHVQRIEQIASEGGYTLGRHKCKAMEGLIEEGKEIIEDDATDEIRDVGLVGAAQRVEHYEMAGYGTAKALAESLGDKNAAKILEKTLNEEKATDAKLTEVAMNRINPKAAAAGDGSDKK